MRDHGLGNDVADLSSVLGSRAPQASNFNGTKGLLLAVLEDGIRSYLSRVDEIRREAEYWVNSSRARSPFCFVVICETLGLEPAAVRQALERMRVQRVDPARTIGRTRPNVRRAHRVSQRGLG
jgi:hypothetical protein